MPHWMKVNSIGILLSAITYIFMGYILYGRKGFSRFWPDLVKHMQKKADISTTTVYLTSFASAILISYIMGCLIRIVRAHSSFTGILVGFLVWIGFILPTIFTPVLFGKKPLEMFYLDAIFYLIIYLAIGYITARFNIL